VETEITPVPIYFFTKRVPSSCLTRGNILKKDKTRQDLKPGTEPKAWNLNTGLERSRSEKLNMTWLPVIFTSFIQTHGDEVENERLKKKKNVAVVFLC